MDVAPPVRPPAKHCAVVCVLVVPTRFPSDASEPTCAFCPSVGIPDTAPLRARGTMQPVIPCSHSNTRTLECLGGVGTYRTADPDRCLSCQVSFPRITLGPRCPLEVRSTVACSVGPFRPVRRGPRLPPVGPPSAPSCALQLHLPAASGCFIAGLVASCLPRRC